MMCKAVYTILLFLQHWPFPSQPILHPMERKKRRESRGAFKGRREGHPQSCCQEASHTKFRATAQLSTGPQQYQWSARSAEQPATAL